MNNLYKFAPKLKYCCKEIMQNKLLKIALMTLVMVWNGFLVAQKVTELTEKDLEKMKKDADKFLQMRRITQAVPLYEKIAQVEPENYNVFYKLGSCYWYMNNAEKARDNYQKAISLKPDVNDTIYFDLGLALKKNGQYDEAVRAFNDFLARHKIKDYYAKQADLQLQGCKFADEESKKKSFDYQLINLELVNTPKDDFDPNIFITKGDSFLVFTSHRAGSVGKAIHKETGQRTSDLWVMRMVDDSTFEKPKLDTKEKKKKTKVKDTGNAENLGKLVNTKANDGSGCVTADGKTLYFTICGKGKISKNYGCSIYKSEFDEGNKTWGAPQLVEALNGEREVITNSRGKKKKVPTYDAQPTLTQDGNTIYFVSDRAGTLGETDIWYSKKAGDAWGPPVNCGKTINSEFSEIHPEIGQNGSALYFATNGHPGIGGYDIFRAEGSFENWSKPVNMGAPINSSGDDFSITWTQQDSIGLFASDREGGAGRDDIYGMVRIPKRNIEVSVHGLVRDKKSKQAIPFATVTLFKIDNKMLVPLDTFKTDQTGAYKFNLELDFDYKLVGNAAEYLANEVQISTKNITETKDLEADIDIFLERIDVKKAIALQNIYYDFDSSALRKESVVELNRLIKILTENPNITIQIGSHTDTNGSENYNIGLGDRRAKSVVDYLSEKDIPKDRLSWFGYGESEPLIYPELSDQDEQMNRRTEFRIQSMDYKPKK